MQAVLYILLILAAMYVIYICFEGFSNNGSVRDDRAGDKPFSSLPIQDRIKYLKEKQDQILGSLQQRR